MDHLDADALDAVLAGEAGPEIREHLDRCADCRAELGAFEELVAGLRPPPQVVPGEVDRRVLTLAARKLARPRFRPVRYAAAAVLLIAILLAIFVAPRGGVPGDVDGSGEVDIVDAYLLAVRVREGRGESRFDVSGDGKVDDEDVDRIARRSVALGSKR